MRIINPFVIFLFLLSVVGCFHDDEDGSNIAACGDGPLLTVLPLDISTVDTFTPLGNLNPSAHVFPTDHTYFYGNSATDLIMPGDGWITAVRTQTANYPNIPPIVDYAIELKLCRQYKVILGHVLTVISDLENVIASQSGRCEEYSTGGASFRQCWYSLERFYNAGTVIGTANGIDLGAYDRRQSPLQWVGQSYITQKDYDMPYTACLEDEYDPVAWALISTVNPRTEPPLCGKIDLDVAGTAQGIWFREGITTLYPEDPHLALVYDAIDPSRASISIGTSLAPTATGVHQFIPNTTGDTDRKFDTITPGSTIYCYKSAYSGQLLLQLPVDRRLLLEHQSSADCTNPPYIMSSNAVVFVR